MKASRRPKFRFATETVKSFPSWLLYFKLQFPDESKLDLLLSRHHEIGFPVPVLDLRGWEEIDLWMNQAVSLGLKDRIRGINISGHTELDIAYLDKIYERFPSFDTLILDGLIQFRPDQLISKFLRFASLHTLSLGGLSVTDSQFENILTELLHLRHIDISRCINLTNNSLKAISKHAFEITSLTAAENPNFSVEGANELVMCCEQLHKLNFSGCEKLTFFGIIISHNGMIQYGSWNVKDINLSNCKDLHLESLMWLEAANPFLHHVQLSNIKQLNDSVVGGIANSCEQLRQLEISNCKKVGSLAMMEISRCCRRHLTTLDASNISKQLDSACIKEILTHCSGLTFFDISNNKKITDEAFTDIPKVVDNDEDNPMIHKRKEKQNQHQHIAHPPKLSHLNIANCPKITTYGLSVIAERNPTLTYLNVSGLKLITDVSLNVVSLACGKKLLTFIADDCERLTDTGIDLLCRGCKSLETLSLSSSTRFTDSWFNRIKQFTDVTIENIFFNLKKLRVLKLRNQCEIHFASPRLNVDYVSRKSCNMSLQELDLSGADYLNPTGLASVLSKCYSLCSLWLTESKSMPWVQSQEFLSLACKHRLYSTVIDVRPTKQTAKLLSSKLGGMSTKSGQDSDRRSSVVSMASASSVGNNSTSAVSRATAGSQPSNSGNPHAIIDSAEIDNPKYIQVLIPLPNIDHLQFRDLLLRKRLLLLFSARVIQQKFRLYRFWKKIRRYVRARQISLWYWQILDHREYMMRLRRFIQKRAVMMIYRAFKNSNLRVKARAAVRIQRVYRGCRAREVVKVLIRKHKAAKRIQSVVRGMLYRLSDHYILSQLYLKLPPFWRTVMDAAPAEKYYERYNMGSEVYKARHHTQNMLEHIKTDISEGRRLAPKLPFIVPQPFDKKPYVSLADGRKIDIFKDVKGLLSTDGMRGAAAVAARRLALQHGIQGQGSPSKSPKKQSFYKAVTGNPRPRSRGSSPTKEAMLLNSSGVESSLTLLSSSIVSHSSSNSTSGDGALVPRPTTSSSTASSSFSDTMNPSSALKKKKKKAREPLEIPYTEHIPVHMFNIVFWPHTEPLEAIDTTTDQHNPALNSFDLIQNKREALYCMLCDKKLRVVNCKTCQKGYCFDCAFRIHSLSLRRKHEIEIIEPRVVTIKEVSNSLIYHIESAQKASYELSYLVKFLRSAAEAKRLSEERRIAKEYELAEEHKRMEYLKALQENEDKHNAATKIALLYHRVKAKKYVEQRRHQKRLERTLSSMHKLDVSFVTVQLMFRRHSTMKWIEKYGFKFFDKKRKRRKALNLPATKGNTKADVPEKDLRARIDFEIQQRRIMTRLTLFNKLYDKYIHAKQLVEVNIASWLEIDKKLSEEEIKLQGLIREYNEAHDLEMQRIAILKTEVSEDEYALLEKELRRLMVRVEAAKERLQSWGALRWWLVQHLRSNYRRKKIVEARYGDTLNRLEWVAVESGMVDRVQFQMQERSKRLQGNKDLVKAADWLKKFSALISKHQATLDTKQETILQEEINRLEIDAMMTAEYDALMEEFLQTATAHTQYIAERCALDQASLVGPGSKQGSEEAVKVSKRLLALRKKQTTLEDTVLDTIKKGLQAKLNNEDERNMNYYGFPNDFPEREVSTFDEIEVVLLDNFENHPHFDVEEFFKVFMAQPWLGEMAVEDVRIEEEITTNEINLGKATEELKGLTFTTKSTEEKMVVCNRKLRELTEEMERRKDSPDGDDELPEDQEERLRILDLLTKEKLGTQAELSLLTGVLENTKNFAVTSRSRMVHFAEEIGRLQGVLEEKRQERIRLAAVFFDKEAVCSAEIHELVAALQADNERKLTDTTHQLRYCEAAHAHPDVRDKIVVGDLSVAEREAFQIPIKSHAFELQRCLYNVKPKINAHPSTLADVMVHTRILSLQKNVSYLEAMKNCLAKEEHILFEFKDRRAGYQNAIKMFQDDIIRLQRQKALQRELDERMERLKFLRETRMRHQMEEKKAKEAALEQTLNVPKKPKINVAAELAKATKKAIRDVKDNYHKMMHEAATAMDEEEIRMANRLKEKSKSGAGPILALRKLYITCGIDEGNAFQEQNRFFEDKGMPYFVQVPKGFGFQLYIWTQNTMKIQEFITHLELGHKDPTHPKYKDLMEDGYEKVEHEKSNIVFWIKRDPKKSRSIADITFSFDSTDDMRNFADGFERLNEEESLEEFGFPPSTIWVRKVDKLKHEERLNVDALVAEYQNVVNMLNKNPSDATLKNLASKVRDRLQAAREKEMQQGEIVNPLTPSVDLMALNGTELENWIAVFRKFDKEKSGALSVERIFETIEETPTSFAKSIFTNMDALDPETGLVECGDFMRVCSTYCFFGKQEILRTLYNFADSKKAGEITHEQFVSLLNVLNPYDKIRAKRALTEMELKSDKIMKFKEFSEINERFPALFYPAFRLQKSMRDHTMGTDWWVDKLKKYKMVRKKIVLIDNNADELAEIQMKRFMDDEKKSKRMAAREQEIKSEASATRRVLLQARQFLDEFS